MKKNTGSQNRIFFRRRMSAVKQKLNNVSLIQKYKVIWLIEKKMTNKAASEKFGIPRNTISTWMKNKSKLLQSLEQTSSNTKKLCGCDYEQVHKAILKWFSLQRVQNIPIDGTMIKTKRCFLLKKFPNFKVSDGCMDKWKKR